LDTFTTCIRQDTLDFRVVSGAFPVVSGGIRRDPDQRPSQGRAALMP
jgi:hypothetical protein